MNDGLDLEAIAWLREYLGDEPVEQLSLVPGEWTPEEVEGYNPYHQIEGKQRKLR